MIVLALITSSLQIQLSGSVATNECPWSASWTAITAGTYDYAPNESDGVTSGATPVTIVASPGSSITRTLKSFFLRNADTALVTVHVEYNNNSTLREIYSAILQVGDCLQYVDTEGFFVTDVAGQIKQAGGFQGFQGPQGNQGNQGSQGWQGTGVQGPQGDQGNQGWQGNQGFQGNASFLNGGESTGADRTLGNNDAFSLGFRTNNAVCFLINSDGSIVQTGATAASVQYALKLAAAQSADAWQIQNSSGTKLMCFDSSGYLRIAGVDAAFPNSPIFIKEGPGTTYLQVVNQNSAGGTSGSSDFVAVADTGTDTTNYVDLGINSSTYADPAYTGQGALDGYLQAYGGYLVVGTATATKSLKFNTGGTLVVNLRMTITDTAVIVNTLPIQGVVDPTNAQDAATKHYVDALVAPIATSLVAFAPGTRNVPIYTVPSPTGVGRFILTRCVVRLSVALVGSGSVSFSVGSTSGGFQIIKATIITSATSLGVIGGEAVSTLGTDMTTLNAYEAVYDYGQNIYANVTVTGTVTNGQVSIYLYGLFLS